MSYRRGWTLSLRWPRMLSARLAALAILCAVGACSLQAEPPLDPARVVLQGDDIPADLQRCPGSGPVDGYLKALGARNPQARDAVEQGWKQLQAAGAAAGAIAVYAANSQACGGEPGAGPGRTAASLVARFADERAAAAAYPKGAMGFPTPAGDEDEPGLTNGLGTQLGPHAWTRQAEVDNRFLTVSYWQDHVFTVYFVGADLDQVEVRKALLAIDGRTA